MSLTTSIVLALEMEGNSSSSVGSFTITDTNVSYLETYGRKSKGVKFTGANSWIKIDNNPGFDMGAGDFGIFCWVKRNVINQRQTFLAKSNSNGNDAAISFWFEWNVSNQLINYFVDTGHNITTLTSSAVADTLYHHVALVRRGSTLYQYIDGVITGSASVAGKTMNSTSHKVGIGVYGEGNSISLNGSMDEVYIWKGYGPTDAEVLQLATNLYYPFTGPSDTLTAGLVSYYKLDGNSTDSINSNNGVDTNITYTTGKISQAAQFTSGSKIIANPLNVGGSSELTVSCWFYKNSSTATALATQYLPQAGGHQWGLVSNANGSVRAIISTDGVSDPLADTINTFNNNMWHHAAFVFNGSLTGNANRLKIYVDGVLQTSTFSGTIGATISVTNVNLWITSLLDNESSFYLNGLLDELGIWVRALSTNEISQLYNYSSGLAYPLVPQPVTLQTALQAYYKLDGNSTDSIGSNNGTDTNITYNTGKINQGAIFNGTSKIQIPNSQTFNFVEFTISGWLKPGTFANNFAGILDKYVGSTSGLLVDIPSNSSRQLRGSAVVTGTPTNLDYSVISNTVLISNVWYHFAVTFSQTRLKIYINGILENTTTFSGALVNNTENISIGGDNVSTYLYDGLLDEIGIWKRELAQSEITTLYNYGSGLTFPFASTPITLKTALQAYYKLNGNSIDSIAGNNGIDSAIVYTNGKISQSAQHNGASSFIKTSGNTTYLTSSSPVTVSCWVKISTNGTLQFLLNVGGNSSTGTRACMYMDSSGILHANFNNLDFASSFNIGDNNWHHVVFTYGGQSTNVTLTVDTISQTGAISPSIVPSFVPGPIVIGSDNYTMPTPSYVLNGNIDEIGVWTRVLTFSEISLLYNNGKGLAYPFTPDTGFLIFFYKN